MVRFVLAVASALALVMFVGASVPSLAREAALPEDAGDSPFRYWPLADGNRWRLAGSGVEFEYAVVELEPGRYRVDTLVNDFPVQREYYHADEAGWIATLREMPAGSFPLEPPQLFLPAPLVPGREWTWEGEITPGLAVTARFAVLDPETVETPVGVFETVPVLATVSVAGETSGVIRWYAEDVGVVRQQEALSAGEQAALLDVYLVEYAVH